MNSWRRAGGFTLIEVMVAFMVLAIAIAATLRMSSRSIDLTQQLRARLLADWIVQDRLEEHRAMRYWPAIGVREGFIDQAGQSFRWREIVAPTQFSRFRRVEIVVSAKFDPDTVLARQVTSVADPGF